jgi:tetratricopeptide (TPR) repeat protein
MAESAARGIPLHAEALPRRFSAFISYSHSDEAFARRLHRRLETYRLPRRLLGKSGQALRPDRRLKPIFRDSDELSASYDLSTAVREAIEHSDHLIVVCSPSAAKSDWVGREIELYRTLHGDERILAVIPPGSGASVFHPALRGWLGGPGLEPMAADFRQEGGGRRLALLKLAAALAEVRLDELVQRDAQRQVLRMTAVGAGAVAGIAVIATLAVFGLNARHDAETQRARIGGLSAFMLTDLRKGLKAAGRLDLQAQVNSAALRADSGEDPAKMTPEAALAHAKKLQQDGETSEQLGDLAKAQSEFEGARRITTNLLAAKPSDPQRIFAQAQSEYWVGFSKWRNGDGVAAKAGFAAYAALTDRLVKIDAKNAAWQTEAGDAESNLGMLALRQAGDLPTAERHFTKALAIFQAVAKLEPSNTDAQNDLADGYGWLADSQRLQGKLADATINRTAQQNLLNRLRATDPRDADVEEHILYNELALARIEAAQGLQLKAIKRLDAAHAAAIRLQQREPDNLNVVKQVRAFELFKVRTLLAMPPAQRPKPAELIALLGNCRPSDAKWVDDETSNFCDVLQARSFAEAGDRDGMRLALAAMHPPTHPEAYSKRWGLDFREEARAVAPSLTEKAK